MNDKSNDDINITIKIGNTRDNNLIVVGQSYFFTMKRNTLIKELLNEFIKLFNDEQQDEIKKYTLFTKKIIKLHDNNTIEDCFSNKEDSNLDIYDKDETIFYVLII